MTLLRVLVLATVTLALAAAPAWAGPEVDQAATALADDPVYVDPDAERAIDAGDERRVEAAIADAGAGPIFLAILPAAAIGEAGGDADGLPALVRSQVGQRGTYGVIAGNSFRAGSDFLPSGQAGRLVRAALDE